MPDNIIRLLSETVANQIAAGEVVQRPASVVKELMENAIDAGADNIQVIVKDAGKLLVQVIDNGCGMNEVDARLSLERHATSKINSADDLFAIRTMGFRGEAIASIVSVSQTELKTRTMDQQLGTRILVDGSEVILQEPCQCPAGTSMVVKNLFYNVPARRNFLKSNTIELKHLYDEFHRVALAHPDKKFSFTENNVVRFQLEKGNLKQRITQIFGASFQKKVVNVEQNTDYLSVTGVIVKPEFSRKTRGEQFFYVNKRFIKSYFLHKVIADTYRPYIPNDAHPGYFLFLEIAPDEIDVNVHPTKTEIKFRNDHHVALMLESSLKYAIGSFNILPPIDFDVEQGVELPLFNPDWPVKVPGITVNPDFNPFQKRESYEFGKGKINFTDLIPSKNNDFYEFKTPENEEVRQSELHKEDSQNNKSCFLFAAGKYIVTIVRSGIMIIDTQSARERIIFEQTLDSLNNAGACASQQLLYPETFDLPSAERDILTELIPELDSIGFNISDLGRGSFTCTAIPAEWDDSAAVIPFIEQVIDAYQCHLLDAKKEKNTSLALAISKRMASKPPVFNSDEEINAFIDRLFATTLPELAPSGNKVFKILDYSEISKLLIKS
jgi:DNA mismatch repair protein MutL